MKKVFVVVENVDGCVNSASVFHSKEDAIRNVRDIADQYTDTIFDDCIEDDNYMSSGSIVIEIISSDLK